jgi:hypothetical protein
MLREMSERISVVLAPTERLDAILPLLPLLPLWVLDTAAMGRKRWVLSCEGEGPYGLG